MYDSAWQWIAIPCDASCQHIVNVMLKTWKFKKYDFKISHCNHLHVKCIRLEFQFPWTLVSLVCQHTSMHVTCTKFQWTDHQGIQINVQSCQCIHIEFRVDYIESNELNLYVNALQIQPVNLCCSSIHITCRACHVNACSPCQLLPTPSQPRANPAPSPAAPCRPRAAVAVREFHLRKRPPCGENKTSKTSEPVW